MKFIQTILPAQIRIDKFVGMLNKSTKYILFLFLNLRALLTRIRANMKWNLRAKLAGWVGGWRCINMVFIGEEKVVVDQPWGCSVDPFSAPNPPKTDHMLLKSKYKAMMQKIIWLGTKASRLTMPNAQIPSNIDPINSIKLYVMFLEVGKQEMRYECRPTIV